MMYVLLAILCSAAGYLLYHNRKMKALLAEKISQLDDLHFILSYKTDTKRTVLLLKNHLNEPSLEKPISIHLTMKIFNKLGTSADNLPSMLSEIEALTAIMNAGNKLGTMIPIILEPLLTEPSTLRIFSRNLQKMLDEKSFGEKMQAVALFLPEPGKKALVGTIISIDDYVPYILCVIPSNYDEQTFKIAWKNMTSEQKSATLKVIKFQKEILYKLQSEGCRRDVADMLQFTNQTIASNTDVIAVA